MSEQRIHRLLRLYPASFRSRFAEDLVATYLKERHRIWREHGRLGAWRFEAVLSARLAWGAVLEWIAHARVGRSGSPGEIGHGRVRGFEATRSDALHVVRALRRSPGFALLVVATLGLGIGANGAMFELADSLLLRSPPHLIEPDEVHFLAFERRLGNDRLSTPRFSHPAWQAVQESGIFAASAAHTSRPQVAVINDSPRRLRVTAISASFWSFFDIAPVLGRFFEADEDRLPSGRAVAVLSHGFWTEEYGRSRDVLGHTLEIGNQVYTIIGVAPAGFRGPALLSTHVFVPITAAGMDMIGADFSERTNASWLSILVRMPAGGEARAAARTAQLLTTHHAQVRGDSAAQAMGIRTQFEPLLGQRGPRPTDAGRLSLWLYGTSVVVLLIACANVATLMMARALRRSKESAIRTALGGGAFRVMVPVVLESLLLALIAGALALPIATGLVAQFARVLLPDTAGTFGSLSTRMVWYACLTVVLAGVMTSWLPARQARRGDLAAVLRTGGGAGRAHSRVQHALPVVQAALSALLLVGAGLFVRSVAALKDLGLGFDAARILVVETHTNNSSDSFRPAEASGFTFDALERATRTLPGVQATTVATSVPFLHESFIGLSLPDGSPAPEGEYTRNTVHPGFFELVGTRILRGRGLDERDRLGAPPVIVVSESLARTVWPGRDAIGQCAHIDEATRPCAEVVGIAEDVRTGDLREGARLQVYVPWLQDPPSVRGSLLIRTAGPAAGIAEPVRAALQAAVPPSILIEVLPMDAIVGLQYRTWTLGARVFGAFGALALVMAAIGLFSVVAWEVTQRTREFGIRVTLGADAARLVRLVLRGAVGLVAYGILGGLGLAVLLAPRVQALLFGVDARDPITFATVGVVLLACAILASVVPALRASRVDPASVLGGE